MSFAADMILPSTGRPALAYLHGRRQSIALPAYAYRARVATEGPSREGPLHLALAGLIDAGVRTIDQAADLLAVESELLELIAQELVGRRWLERKGEDWVATAQAKDKLDEVAEPTTVPLFVFVDALSGQLWPRVALELTDSERTEESDDRRPVLLGGSVGRPQTTHPFYLEEGVRLKHDAPTPEAVERKLKEHLRHERSRRRPSSGKSGQWVGEAVGQIGLVEVDVGQPIAVWLVSELYVPEDELQQRAWRAVDPFGFGDLPWLRRNLDRLRTEGNKGVGTAIARLYPNADEPDSQEAAELEVEAKLSINVRRCEGLLADLVYVEAHLRELGKLSPLAAKARHRRGEIARTLGLIVESALAAVCLDSDVGLNARRQFELIGVSACVQAIESLRRQTLAAWMASVVGEIDAAKQGRGQAAAGGLGGLLVSALAAAALDSAHPLAAAFAEDQSFLDRLDALRRYRNEHQHRRSKNQQASIIDAPSDHVETCYRLLELTLSHMQEGD